MKSTEDISLSKDISKALLIIYPMNVSPSIISTVRYSFFELGFIVVREGTQRLYPELINQILQDQHPVNSSISSERKNESLLGDTYIFVVARKNCFSALKDTLRGTYLLRPDASTTLFSNDVNSNSQDNIHGKPIDIDFKLLKSAQGLPHRNRSFRQSVRNAQEFFILNQHLFFLHASSRENIAAIRILFPRLHVDVIPLNSEAQEYTDTELKSILIDALTLLLKKKPKDPISWLANFLLEA